MTDGCSDLLGIGNWTGLTQEGGASATAGANGSSASSSSNGSTIADTGPPGYGGIVGGNCTGTVADSNAVIDDMTATTITFVPPACAASGGWYTFVDDDAGTIFPAPGSFGYLSLPADFPGPVPEAGLSSAKAACVSGTTAAAQYAVAQMGIQLSAFGSPTDAGIYTPALLDASAFTGIEFWLWVPGMMTATLSSAFVVQFFDRQEDPTLGVCNPSTSAGVVACGAGGAAILRSLAAVSNGAGPLLAPDGGNANLVSGWQLVRAPWRDFVVNPFFGGANENVLDPTTLTRLVFEIDQTQGDAGAGIPFDFCISDVQFYH